MIILQNNFCSAMRAVEEMRRVGVDQKYTFHDVKIVQEKFVKM